MSRSFTLQVNAEDRYLSINETAELIGVNPVTIRRWEKSGDFIPFERTKGNHRRYRYSDVVIYKKAREINKRQIKTTEFPIKFEEDYGMKKNELHRSVVIRETKAFQIIIEYNMDKPLILIIILSWLLSMVVKLTHHLGLSELEILADRLNQDFIDSVGKFKDDLEIKELEIMRKKPVNPGKRSPASKWETARKYASSIFFQLIRASNNMKLDEDERNRAQELSEKIVAPFSKLTGFLSDYHPGTLKHDIAMLLLTRKPIDFDYLRGNWSIRLLSKVCSEHLTTKSASKSQVGRLLKEIKWYCSPKRKLHSPDPEYGAIIKKIAMVMNSLGNEDIILFGDEFKYTSTKIDARLEPKYLPNGLQYVFPKGNLRNDSLKNYQPTSSIQITGLYDPITKKLGIKEIRNNSFKEFNNGLMSILDHFSKLKDGKIFLILDNASYHGKSILGVKLNQIYHNRIEIIWLPVYSPNNNPIEKIWDKLLSTVDRECNNKVDLRKSLELSIGDYKINKPKKNGYHSLTCLVCHEKWEFRNDNKNENTRSIEKHLCFSVPRLNPYSIHALTHSQEVFHMGQYT